MFENIKISIILTTFNRAHLIDKMINSIKAQTHNNWECLIIDDNSKDNTKAIVKELIKDEERFQFIVKPLNKRKGLPSSRNIGIKKAKGNYIVFFDDDDIVHPQLLEFCIKSIKKYPNSDFVHYKKKSFTNKLETVLLKPLLIDVKKIETKIFEDVIIGELPLASCTVLWKTTILQSNLFNENLMYAEEWECYSRILIKNNLKGLLLNNVLYFNKKHPNSNTSEFWNNAPNRVNSKKEASKNIIETLQKHQKLTNKLAKYFIYLSYHYKDKSIANLVTDNNLKYSCLNFIFPVKYYLYKFLKK